MNKIELAKQLATEAHESIKQTRKDGRPYIVHPIDVAEIVKTVTDNEDMIAAAYLHDVLEDVTEENSFYSEEWMKYMFGDVVLQLVKELTNVYTKKNHPTLNRKTRKDKENERISKISNDAKTVKVADIIANISDLHLVDFEFADRFIREKKEMLKGLNGANKTLLTIANLLVK